MKIILLGLLAVQIVFSIIALGLAAGIRAKFGTTPSWFNFFIFTAVSSFVIAAILLVVQAVSPRPSRAVPVATTVLSIIWTIFWIAAVAALGSKVVFGDSGDLTGSVEYQYTNTYTYGSYPYNGVSSNAVYGYESNNTLVSMAKAAWAFGFLAMIVWFILAVASPIAYCAGLRNARNVDPSPNQPKGPQYASQSPQPQGQPVSYAQPYQTQGQPSPYPQPTQAQAQPSPYVATLKPAPK